MDGNTRKTGLVAGGIVLGVGVVLIFVVASASRNAGPRSQPSRDERPAVASTPDANREGSPFAKPATKPKESGRPDLGVGAVMTVTGRFERLAFEATSAAKAIFESRGPAKPVVFLRCREFGEVWCFFESQEEWMTRLRSGDALTISGKFMSLNGEILYLGDCALKQ